MTSEVLTGNSLRSSGRFGGLQELFHVAKWPKRGLAGITDDMMAIFDHGKLTDSTKVSVRTEYRTIKEKVNKQL